MTAMHDDAMPLSAERPLRILVAHNHHADPGGFEVFFHGVTALLRRHGHHVVTFERDNASLDSLWQKVPAFGSAIHSPSSRRAVAELLRDEQIDLVHLNNLWPLISPSVIDACRDAGVPVVMSLQDYKLTCPAGQHLRDGRICTKCLGGREFWCAAHGCRENRVQSTAYAVRNIVTRLRGTIHDGVTLYLPCSQFIADHHVRGGYDAARMHVLPNFTDLPDDTEASNPSTEGGYVAYIGRISPEKGLPVLIEAARQTGLPVRIAGNAAKMPELARTAPPNVQFVGKLSREQLPTFYREARFSVVPSTWYECFGIVAAESLGYGRPVIVSRIGGLPEVVEHERTGLLVTPGDPADLAAAMRRLWDEPDTLRRMSLMARERAQQAFAPQVFYRRLVNAYAKATALHRHEAASHPRPTRITSLPVRDMAPGAAEGSARSGAAV